MVLLCFEKPFLKYPLFQLFNNMEIDDTKFINILKEKIPNLIDP